MQIVGGFIALGLLLVLYFVPSIVAHNRAHPSRGSIYVVNFFLGWTLLGWVVALAWAVNGASGGAPRSA
ncbi:superinfection immunity protein [bacterium]|jgi:hypothetical protein|nr:superinfection immunity protein [bacterium]